MGARVHQKVEQLRFASLTQQAQCHGTTVRPRSTLPVALARKMIGSHLPVDDSLGLPRDVYERANRPCSKSVRAHNCVSVPDFAVGKAKRT